MGDEDQNDWVHKEIFTALQSGCNIIPITGKAISLEKWTDGCTTRLSPMRRRILTYKFHARNLDDLQPISLTTLKYMQKDKTLQVLFV